MARCHELMLFCRHCASTPLPPPSAPRRAKRRQMPAGAADRLMVASMPPAAGRMRHAIAADSHAAAFRRSSFHARHGTDSRCSIITAAASQPTALALRWCRHSQRHHFRTPGFAASRYAEGTAIAHLHGDSAICASARPAKRDITP